jgi:hypothetical protein
MKEFLLVLYDVFVSNFPPNFAQMPALPLRSELLNEFPLRPQEQCCPPLLCVPDGSHQWLSGGPKPDAKQSDT